MAYYLALDAGGTKTECALAADELLLARATGGSIKILRVSPEEAEKNLDALLHAVSMQSGVALHDIDRVCAGMSGISVPRVETWIRHALRSRIGGELLLGGDEEIALDAAFAGHSGVLVVAGTGSNIIGRANNGEQVHVGGWGSGVADEGSGVWIGKQAVRAIFDALDHDEPTQLLPAVLDHWNLPNVGSLVELSNQEPAPDFSTLAPLVAEHARQNDSYALRVLDHAGVALGTYAVLTARRVLKLEPEARDCPEIAFTGGILRHVLAVRQSMCATILHKLPSARINMKPIDPLEGALWRTRQFSEVNRNPAPS